jgi:hypothetical protein
MDIKRQRKSMGRMYQMWYQIYDAHGGNRVKVFWAYPPEVSEPRGE